MVGFRLSLIRIILNVPHVSGRNRPVKSTVKPRTVAFVPVCSVLVGIVVVVTAIALGGWLAGIVAYLAYGLVWMPLVCFAIDRVYFREGHRSVLEALMSMNPVVPIGPGATNLIIWIAISMYVWPALAGVMTRIIFKADQAQPDSATGCSSDS